jgi:hypothetical protein
MDIIANHPVLSFVGWLAGALLLIGLYHGLAHMFARFRLNRMRARLSQARLEVERALHDYPLYDPPHKVEERRLPKEKAAENFDYFMRVRMRRVVQLREWLRQHFAVTVTLDEEGVRALGRWGNDYAGWLLARGAEGHPRPPHTYYHPYYAYDPPWTGENAGMNVVFDIGITLGEAMIANCPKLHWDFDPISAILPGTARMLKRTPGLGFQRPMLTGFDNPAYQSTPLEVAFYLALHMTKMTTVEGVEKFHDQPRGFRRLDLEQLVRVFKDTLQNYPEGDPHRLRKQMRPQEFLRFVDAESEEADDGSDQEQPH